MGMFKKEFPLDQVIKKVDQESILKNKIFVLIDALELRLKFFKRSKSETLQQKCETAEKIALNLKSLIAEMASKKESVEGVNSVNPEVIDELIDTLNQIKTNNAINEENTNVISDWATNFEELLQYFR